MSRTVCSWCNAPLVLKDDILVCGNTDCPACDEKYLHEELIRIQELLDIESAEHSMCHTQMLKTTEKLERTRKALDVAVGALKVYANPENWDCEHFYSLDTYDMAADALEQITALEQKD